MSKTERAVQFGLLDGNQFVHRLTHTGAVMALDTQRSNLPTLALQAHLRCSFPMRNHSSYGISP